jgi:sarcosine oxidase subunit gamma
MSETHTSPDHAISMGIERRSPLAEFDRVFGDGTRLTVRAEGTLLLLLSRPGSVDGGWIRQQLDATAPEDLRSFSPGQWLLVSGDLLDHAAIAERLRQRVEIVDQSHGRVRLELTGPNVPHMLAHATGLDLHAGLAASTTTLFGHISVHVTRIAPDVFELIAMRSFAESLVDEIARMCRMPQSRI